MSQVTSDRNEQGIMLYSKVNRKRRIKFFQLKSRFIFQKDLDIRQLQQNVTEFLIG